MRFQQALQRSILHSGKHSNKRMTLQQALRQNVCATAEVCLRFYTAIRMSPRDDRCRAQLWLKRLQVVINLDQLKD
jgi:hypothetical protein